MSHVHTDSVSVRHDELDGFGLVRASALLRWLVQLAVDASTAAGFGPDWYDAEGLMWLVRRTMVDLERPVVRGERLSLRTWVEDFRRVRSHRAYEVCDDTGATVVRGRTDWVLIDVRSGRPVRVPRIVEEAFGVPADRAASQRPVWQGPAAPAAAARMEHDVRFADLDSLAHVNNATYLDLLTDATLGAFVRAGWSPDRMRESGMVPWVRRLDVEYLDAAVWGDRLGSTTWVAETTPDLEVYQLLARTTDASPLVRARADWGWRGAGGVAALPPAGLVDALESVRAA